MTTQIATIQVRTGLEQDIEALDKGEFGLAEDSNRLFLGTLAQTFAADGVTATYSIDLTKIKFGSTVYARVNGVAAPITVNWTGTTGSATFLSIPPAGAQVSLSYNSELSFKGQASVIETLTATLAGNTTSFTESTVKFTEATTNSIVIDYSISGNGYKQIGNMYIIVHDGSIDYVVNGITAGPSQPKVELAATLVDDVISITFTNSDAYDATFYYSVRAWRTN
jgi:hypothetical protein